MIQAPPGAGKTTRVPLALLEEGWLRGRKLVMLEPRRLAARTAARRMASELGEAVGATVGYRVRMDTRVGPKTRIEIVIAAGNTGSEAVARKVGAHFEGMARNRLQLADGPVAAAVYSLIP